MDEEKKEQSAPPEETPQSPEPQTSQPAQQSTTNTFPTSQPVQNQPASNTPSQPVQGQPQPNTPPQSAQGQPEQGQPATNVPPQPAQGQPAQPAPNAPSQQTTPPPQPQAQQSSSSKGTAALVCGILAIVFCWFPIASIVLGIIAIIFAVRTKKASGKSGKTTASLVCAIIGMVLAVIMIVVTLVVGFATMQAINDSSYTPQTQLQGNGSQNRYGNGAGNGNGTATGQDLNDDEQACCNIARQEMDSLKNQDPARVDALADLLDEGIEDLYGFDHDILGQDPHDLAVWMLTDFDYKIDDVYESSDNSTCQVYIDITQRDPYVFINTLIDGLNNLMNDPNADSMTSQQAIDAVHKCYSDALNAKVEMTSYYATMNFYKQSDGTWQLDAGDWEDQLRNIFDIPDLFSHGY